MVTGMEESRTRMESRPHPAERRDSAQSKHISARDLRLKECAKNCRECARACFELVAMTSAGLSAEFIFGHRSHLISCYLICETGEKFMALQSECLHEVCGVCAEVCIRCAESLEKAGEHDLAISSCVSLCRLCAESCEIVAGMQ